MLETSEGQPTTGHLYGLASQKRALKASSYFPSGVDSVRMRRSSYTTSRSE
jgi:hypothetical protein